MRVARAAPEAGTIASVLRRAGTYPRLGDRPAIRFEDRVWTHREYFEECCRWANLFLDRLPADGAPHVGVMLDNTPDFTFALGGAALSGAVVVGLNHTHRDEFLLDDIVHTDVALLVTEPRNEGLFAGIADRLRLPSDRVLVSHRHAVPEGIDAGMSLPNSEDLDEAVNDYPSSCPDVVVSAETLFSLIFTSGTSGRPKAVMYTQGRVASGAASMVDVLGLTADDVAYMSMPLFHSQSLYVNWAPVMVVGASTALARRFSASRWLDDIRKYEATVTNYTGTPLGYLLARPERPDDADNPLRVAFGNEGASPRLDAFARRFDVRVIEVYGATEGAWGTYRDEQTPPDALGPAPSGVLVVDDNGHECPRARFDENGVLLNPGECIGEMVDTAPETPFPGYYGNPDATAAATRGGWFWSDDLGYVDDDGYLYFAGRTAERIRVGGENFAAVPIEEAIAHHPEVTAVAVYGVPDAEAGDQVMAALVLRAGAELDPEGLGAWFRDHPSLSPTWRPRYLRMMDALPTTPSQKVLKRELVHQKFRLDRTDGDRILVWSTDDGELRPFAEQEEAELWAIFATADRLRFWDL